jgi:hypothetical protein
MSAWPGQWTGPADTISVDTSIAARRFVETSLPGVQAKSLAQSPRNRFVQRRRHLEPIALDLRDQGFEHLPTMRVSCGLQRSLASKRRNLLAKPVVGRPDLACAFARRNHGGA